MTARALVTGSAPSAATEFNRQEKMIMRVRSIRPGGAP